MRAATAQFLHGLRTQPARRLLSLIQLILAALTMTLALGALTQLRRSAVSTDFMVVAGNDGQTRSGDVQQGYALFRAADLRRLQEQAPAVEHLSAYAEGFGYTIAAPQGKFRLYKLAQVSPTFPSVTPTELITGTFLPGKEGLVLSERLAGELFAGADATRTAIGRTLTLTAPWEGAKPRAYTVQGVVNDLPPGSALRQAELYLPAAERSQFLLVRARTGQEVQAQQQLLAAVRTVYARDPVFRHAAQQVYISTTGFEGVAARPSRDLNLSQSVFMGLALVLLTVSMLGLFSTSLVEVSERTREIGLRKALGASRGVILREHLLRTLVPTLLGAAGGMALAALLTPALNSMLGGVLGAQILLSFPVIGLTLLLLTLSAVLFTLYPSVLAANLRPVEAMNDVI